VRQAGVAVLFVGPLDELLAKGAAVLDAAEAIRELRAVVSFQESLRAQCPGKCI